MKTRAANRVPLSKEALILINSLPRLAGNQLIFPAHRGGMLSDKAISAAMRALHESVGQFIDAKSKHPAVPHALRSTFRQWTAGDGYDRDMAEMALAHKVGSQVERASQRSDMLERRRALMQAWADCLAGLSTDAKVLRFV